MVISKWNADEELWETVLTLINEHHYSEAFSVIKAIAVQTIQEIGGSLAFSNLSSPKNKTLDEAEVLHMRALSKQISGYEANQKTELITEYVGRFVHLLTDTPKDAEEMHRKFLRSFIEPNLGRERDSMIIHENSSPAFRTQRQKYDLRDRNTNFYTSSQAAEIGGVSDQTIRRRCEKGKFPDAYQTEGGHWRIPQKYFKVTLEEARKSDSAMKKIHDSNKQYFGEDVDEFDIDIDYS